MSSVSWCFFMSPCMLSLHLFLGRPLLLLPETSSLSDFALMWLRSRLKQSPNHFSLLFSRNVPTGFTWASFLMSSFLMWSNRVFPLAHLNILNSAEFKLILPLHQNFPKFATVCVCVLAMSARPARAACKGVGHGGTEGHPWTSLVSSQPR